MKRIQPTRRQQRNRLAILELLNVSPKPLSSARIADSLTDSGYDVSERTVRAYLKQMDDDGLTECIGRSGRIITQQGRSEVGASRILERIGFVSARIDRLSFQMNFDLIRRAGTVVANLTIVEPHVLRECLDDVVLVFDKGYAMGTQVALLAPGEALGETMVPKGYVGLCTVCSVTLNGVLLNHGVPVRSPYSGLLELRDGNAMRFAELISYEGTSLDPLAMFIRGGMTNYLGAIHEGTGLIGAGFREIPAESHEMVAGLAAKLDTVGMGAFMSIGCPGQMLLNLPVREGCCGMVVIGGLNPVSIMVERGFRIRPTALAGLIEYHRLHHYSELPDKLAALGF
jgi:repressor of nif and glnA expression